MQTDASRADEWTISPPQTSRTTLPDSLGGGTSTAPSLSAHNLLRVNLTVRREPLQPALRHRGAGIVRVILQELAKSLRGILIAPNGGQRLGNQELGLRCFAFGLLQRFLRFGKRAVVLTLRVIGLGQSPMRLPACGIDRYGLLKRRHSLFVLPGVDVCHSQRGKRVGMLRIDPCDLFKDRFGFVPLGSP